MARIILTVWPELVGEQRLFLKDCLDVLSGNHQVYVLTELNEWISDKHRIGYGSQSKVLDDYGLNPSDLDKWKLRLNCFYGGGLLDPQSSLDDLLAAANGLLDSINPDLVALWNPMLPRYGVLDDMCRHRSIARAYLEHGFLPGSFLFDLKGVGPRWSGVETRIEDIQKSSRLGEYVAVGELVTKELSLDPPKSLYRNEQVSAPARLLEGKCRVLILGPAENQAGHKPYWHRNSREVMPHFRNLNDFLCHLIEVDGLDIVVKRHPYGSDALSEYVLSKGVVDTTSDPVDEIRDADIVVSFGTKLELNALLLRKPTIVVANSWLRNKGFSIDVTSPESLHRAVELIRSGKWVAPPDDVVHAFLGWYLVHHAYGARYGGTSKLSVAIDNALEYGRVGLLRRTSEDVIGHLRWIVGRHRLKG